MTLENIRQENTKKRETVTVFLLNFEGYENKKKLMVSIVSVERFPIKKTPQTFDCNTEIATFASK